MIRALSEPKRGMRLASISFAALLAVAPMDPAVKALARFPDVIRKMSENLDWTTDLGDAFANQPKDVADVIQALRAEADKAGALKTTAQQTVTSSVQDGRSIISIASTDPIRHSSLPPLSGAEISNMFG